MTTKLSRLKKILIPASILILATVLRLLFLEWKPPHFDEGINGWFADQAISMGYYNYDPTNYHGPLHFYLIILFKFFMGHSLLALRLPSAVFGIMTVWLMLEFKKVIPQRVAWLAAFFIAISPGMIFYSRYSIHESEFVFFALLFIFGFFRNLPWVWSLAFAGCVITKETWTISAICFLIAATGSRVFFKDENRNKLKFKWIPIAVSSLIVLIFYSGFFRNLRGIASFFKAYLPWLKTGIQGNGHEKTVTYWLTLFSHYEIFALVGIVAAIAFVFSKKKKSLSFFSIFGLIQLIIYSWIPYKTPWCSETLLFPLLISAAYGFDFLLEKSLKPLNKLLVIFVILLFSVSDLERAISLNFVKFTDQTEPYVYVQTLPEVMDVMKVIQQARLKNPEVLNEPLIVVMKSQWPMPWLLADFTHSYYYSDIPSSGLLNNLEAPDALLPDAAVIFTDVINKPLFDAALSQSYYFRVFKLRPAMDEVVVYFSKQMFENNNTDIQNYELLEKDDVSP